MRSLVNSLRCLLLLFFLIASTKPLSAQFDNALEQQLKSESAESLATAAAAQGDPVRGAILFHQPQLQCSRCHSVGLSPRVLPGPVLTELPADVTDAALVESILHPSRAIRKGYETVVVVTADGRSVSGLLASATDEGIRVRDTAFPDRITFVPAVDVDEFLTTPVSLMPQGLVNQLAGRQQFLDLLRYLTEIRRGGAARAEELQPAASLLTFRLPEYEENLDHRGLIEDLNDDALKRGEETYRRVCQNCHGTKDLAGSLPTSLKFNSGKFRSGSDPLTMYRTLTSGFGLMAAQTWMVPSQKYDVIHFIRETMLKPDNPSQYFELTEKYLADLPAGETRGPAPSLIQPWNAMDYGPSLTHSIEVPGPKHNIAQKGIAVRLDPGAGGVSRGSHWMLFETDTLRMAAAWHATERTPADEKFINWRGIQFNGQHNIHPTVSGTVIASVPNEPGWAEPGSDSFADLQRVTGRDDRRYGPLPDAWGRFRGQHHVGGRTVLDYTIGETEIQETPGLSTTAAVQKQDGEAASALPNAFLRTFRIGSRSEDLLLQVCQQPNSQLSLQSDGAVLFGPAAGETAQARGAVRFDGGTWLQTETGDAAGLAVERADFTIAARIRTTEDGTITALTAPDGPWVRDGQAFFLRGGKLTFDIGWVGAVSGTKKVSDGKWHDVAVTRNSKTAEIRFWVDGKADGGGRLAVTGRPDNSVFRIGYTADNFPREKSAFTGEIASVTWMDRETEGDQTVTAAVAGQAQAVTWMLESAVGEAVESSDAGRLTAKVLRAVQGSAVTPLVAGVTPAIAGMEWIRQEDRLCLRIPAGESAVNATLWMISGEESVELRPTFGSQAADLDPGTLAASARWPQTLQTEPVVLHADGPFAADVLTAPEVNPWLARTRFTGLDFFADGRLAACSWDGDVWIISGVGEGEKLTWKRFASGLFQPLGLKIVDGQIYLTCRDQLAILHDTNDDGEADYIQCFNNQQQVTEHFHEFAMGLQRDADGNFYYAKSARHALPAVVPHHGTLLRVSPDGSRTDIIANGFRAANGVCLNPDGSFVVTDQEGHWNPKNRINWVRLKSDGSPNFYGNIFGYHDVTDTSDDAMVPPLCWITNAFDRSPGELLWVDSERWGPLNGSLLNLSYGYGKVFLVPHEEVNGQMQGGMIQLPLPSFPTGVMRGRFSPHDGHLYLCGMFAWAGSATHQGGIYRIRATEQNPRLPLRLNVVREEIRLGFSDQIRPESATPKSIKVTAWDLRRTANYGSKHYNERELKVQSVTVSEDGYTVTLAIPDLPATWGMEIQYSLQSHDGKPVEGKLHNTIHQFGKSPRGETKAGAD